MRRPAGARSSRQRMQRVGRPARPGQRRRRGIAGRGAMGAARGEARSPAAARAAAARAGDALAAGCRPRTARCAAARRCRDAAARRTPSAAAPLSTISPAYITATRSAISATTGRLWVMNTSAMPRSRFSVGQQVQHLRLDGDVQRRGRLVGDQQRAGRWRSPWRSWPAGACRRTSRAGRRGRGAPGSGMPTWRSSATTWLRSAARDAAVRADGLGDLRRRRDAPG